MKFWLIILSTILFSACSHPDRQAVDKLNSLSYAYHYRDIDSTEHYAQKAYDLSSNYDKGKAEALNNLAFVDIVKMQYDQAERYLNDIPQVTDNQIELFVCYVQQMRLCQRRSSNREFHEYRELADRVLNRINEERGLLSEEDRHRLLYAETEYAIVNSTYYYYVGLERQSIEALQAIDPNEVQRDTAQYLNYLYNIGAGGILTEGTQEEINQQEFDHLLRCFMIARQGGYPYFAANALEALSEHLMDPDYRRQLISDNLPAMKFLNPEGVDEEMLSGWLAESSLSLFTAYGDVYQIAGAYRTLASCYRQIGDFESTLFNLEQALSDTIIYQAPDLVASIREQLSVAYSAMDEKAKSDENRNSYIDLMTETRQDRQLEARASQLEATASQLNWMLIAVGIAIVLLLFSLWLFNHLHKKQKDNHKLDDLIEQRQDEVAMERLRVENNERRHLEQRAKISLVNGITPFIDRIIYAVHKGGDEDYIRELTTQINDYNDILTHWIQLRQGELNLKIETFALQPLFDIVAKGRKSLEMKGITLEVEKTGAQVKADRILTLFMLNTLVDNARKFTPRQGRVDVSATETDQYVEIAVADTGSGMNEEQLAHLFETKPIHDEGAGGHGFGLLNCKGIIEKYRKISQIFSVCSIAAESEVGKGSRLFFRLPKGIMRLVVALFTIYGSVPASADNQEPVPVIPIDDLGRASIFVDSAYFSNINGTFESTLAFADSCRYYLNRYYKTIQPDGSRFLLSLGNPSLVPPEIEWFHDSLDINYAVILDMRNEVAVAALALHEWQLYSYNNKIYTQLYKEMSADNTLADYCRQMQESQTNKRIAVILLIILLLAILPAYYLLYYRHRLYNRFIVERKLQTSLELADDELRRAELENNNLHVSNAVLDNCLSTLKHETMYYPSRIQQLLDQGDMESVSEVVSYYRELYGLLSQQAMHQVEGVRLHLQPLADGILGDKNLIAFLFEILRKQGGAKKSISQKDDKYLEITVPMPQLHLSDEEAQNLFNPRTDHIPYLLCRQIVRDHGEATNRRMCGIWAENDNETTIIKIILPSVCKTSK
jgi:signal transduction histidine kinase